jgi:radial spoke head protein 9
VPPKAFTELDRLAYTIRAIDIDCASLPVGALKLSPLHELRYNDSFKGLSTDEAVSLENYQHFRNPLTPEKQEFISISINDSSLTIV